VRVVAQIPNDDLRLAQTFARDAEKAGFDGVVALENAHNPYLPLAAAALVTERLELGTAVAMAFPRSPTTTAHVAWDVHKASGGRCYLGLGSQVKAHNERRFGVAWSAPAPRMRDYVGAVRAIWECWERGVPLDYHSDTFNLTLMTPNFSPRPTGLPRIPISMAAVGPAMLHVAASVCNGVRLHPFSTRRYLQEVSSVEIAEGLKRSGRDRRNLEVIAFGFIATGPDDAAVAEMREYVRFRIAFYCSTRDYWNVLRLHGMEELGHTVNPYPRAGRWNEMAALISDDVLELFATVATYDELPAKLEARYGGLADTIQFPVKPGFDVDRVADVIRRIQRIPCPFERHANDWANEMTNRSRDRAAPSLAD
jgi:probable F420-dependent oxidoreductase